MEVQGNVFETYANCERCKQEGNYEIMSWLVGVVGIFLVLLVISMLMPGLMLMRMSRLV